MGKAPGRVNQTVARSGLLAGERNGPFQGGSARVGSGQFTGEDLLDSDTPMRRQSYDEANVHRAPRKLKQQMRQRMDAVFPALRGELEYCFRHTADFPAAPK